MPKYEPSPLDESMHRYDADAAAVSRHVNRLYVFGVIALVVVAAIALGIWLAVK